jgi:glycosyltransferase involved in cell wall biosynthesis
MKLIIQIPCYNEEETLGTALAQLPREVPGFDTVEWLIIDDGSTDRTAEVARENGVDHIVRHTTNLGLARGFMNGLDAGLKAGADVIVNTDADNQYEAADIPKLVKPILDGDAEIVVGERPISQTSHFSPIKKLLQKLGSWVVRVVSKTTVPDAPSGFRAISKEAALKLNVFNEYTYTLETIIQAGQKGIAITSVPIRTNEDLRPSKLVKSISSYVRRSLFTIVRIFAIYKPLKFFFLTGSVPFIAGILLIIRWLYYFIYAYDVDRARVPSLVAASILVMLGAMLWMMGFMAEVTSANRKILEEIQERTRRADVDRATRGQ